MKSEKINLNDLLQSISVDSDQQKGVIEQFLKSLFTEIEEGLRNDKVVKISGFGTFKLQAIEARKSVNINTGEEITIEGYNKVSFSPEAALREKVNEPFAHLETVKIDGDTGAPIEVESTPAVVAKDEPIRRFGAQAEEIKDLLTEINELPSEKENPAEVKDEEQDTDHILSVGENIVETVVETAVESRVEEVPEQEVKTEVINEITNNKEEEVMKNGTKTEVTNKPKRVEPVKSEPMKRKVQGEKISEDSTNWKMIGFSVCFICIALVVVCFFCLGGDKEPKVKEIAAEPVVTEPIVEEVSIFDQPRVYTEFIATENLPNGSRLAWLSRKYYGVPDFWVYIYEANKEVVADPNHILINTTIKIPKVAAELIDVNNPACLEYAKKLHDEYVK